MSTKLHRVLAATTALLAAAALAVTSAAAPAGAKPGPKADVRFATFNATLSDDAWDGQEFVEALSGGELQRAQQVAEVIQRSRPDVLLINEFNFVEDGAAAEVFRDDYLAVSQNGADPIDYPYYFVAPVNTGVASGVDLNNDGTIDTTPGDFSYANDAFGFGLFPGQYGMVVFSKFPIAEEDVRTFQEFLWADMPDSLMPREYYAGELDVVRLSSKSHWDVPIKIGRKTVHFLVSHPTPPVFDDPEIDWNGRRNHDEIRFWADYVRPGKSGYIYDDAGETGGLQPGAPFVIAGDMNADPHDGDSTGDPAELLLQSPRVNTKVTPASQGGVVAAADDGGINLEHEGNPAFDTADFGEPPGNLRVDYVLPSKRLRIVDAAVFWPTPDSELAYLADVSDHHLVWVDLAIPGVRMR
jgi:hypothetical protein